MNINKDIDNLVLAYRKKGYQITRDQAEGIWDDYSVSLYASWISMPGNLDELYEITKEFAEDLI